MVAAVGQVEVGGAAVVVRVHQLVRDRELDLARVLQAVVAEDDAVLGRKAAADGVLAARDVEKGARHGAAALWCVEVCCVLCVWVGGVFFVCVG